MKEFKIPLIDQSVFLYIGEDEYYKWVESGKRENPHLIHGEVCEGLTGGSTSGRLVWIGNGNDDNLIFHELSHYLHFVFELMACEKENEFKAYVSSWVYGEVYKYIQANKTTTSEQG